MKYLFDAGFGMIFKKTILEKQQQLGVFFPIWLSNPDIGDPVKSTDQLKFRWLISFEQSL